MGSRAWALLRDLSGPPGGFGFEVLYGTPALGLPRLLSPLLKANSQVGSKPLCSLIFCCSLPGVVVTNTTGPAEPGGSSAGETMGQLSPWPRHSLLALTGVWGPSCSEGSCQEGSGDSWALSMAVTPQPQGRMLNVPIVP